MYEPVKIGYLQGRIFVEIHQDIYAKIPDMLKYAMKRIQDHNLAGRINWLKLMQAVEEQSGAPVDISPASNSSPPVSPHLTGLQNLR